MRDFMQRSRVRAPYLAMGLLAVTVLVSTAGFADHALIRILDRNAGAIAAGQWWRLLTSLLVHDHWWQFSLNCVLLVLLGFEAERLSAGSSACCRGLQPMVGQSKLKLAPAR